MKQISGLKHTRRLAGLRPVLLPNEESKGMSFLAKDFQDSPGTGNNMNRDGTESCSQSGAQFGSQSNSHGSHGRVLQMRGFAASAQPDSIAGEAGVGPCEECQSTGRNPEDLFCSSCGNLQPLDANVSYFKLMHQAKGSFSVNHSLLDKRYKDLQRQLHPDKFSTHSQSQQEISANASAIVNEAFQTLKSPLKRGEYLLALNGEEIGEGIQSDPELLMTIMEARETIENTDSQAELEEFANIFSRQQDDCIKGVEDAFNKNDIERAKGLLGVLRYLTNIQEAIQLRLE